MPSNIFKITILSPLIKSFSIFEDVECLRRMQTITEKFLDNLKMRMKCSKR